MPLYDCSHPIESGMPVVPGDPAVTLTAHATRRADGYRVTALELGSHAGTHIDAPCHTEPDGASLGEYPMERFRFDARLVDVRGRNPRDPIGSGAVPDTDAGLVVFRTGWDDHWGTAAYFEHPYLTPAAAERCVAAGYHVALDTPSPDPTPTDDATSNEPTGVPAHRALLGADRLIIENLTGLDPLGERFTLHAYPMALDADGAPIRAVAEPTV